MLYAIVPGQMSAQYPKTFEQVHPPESGETKAVLNLDSTTCAALVLSHSRRDVLTL